MMARPTCPTCVPFRKPFPSGMAWAHSMKCKVKKQRGQKIVVKKKPDELMTSGQARAESIRSQRHMAETARTGLGLATTTTLPRAPIPLIAPGPECPGHPSEDRYDCIACERLSEESRDGIR